MTNNNNSAVIIHIDPYLATLFTAKKKRRKQHIKIYEATDESRNLNQYIVNVKRLRDRASTRV